MLLSRIFSLFVQYHRQPAAGLYQRWTCGGAAHSPKTYFCSFATVVSQFYFWLWFRKLLFLKKRILCLWILLFLSFTHKSHIRFSTTAPIEWCGSSFPLILILDLKVYMDGDLTSFSWNSKELLENHWIQSSQYFLELEIAEPITFKVSLMLLRSTVAFQEHNWWGAYHKPIYALLHSSTLASVSSKSQARPRCLIYGR